MTKLHDLIAARIAANMGVNRICVVHDVMPAMEPMLKLATHHASHLIHNLEYFNGNWSGGF